MNKRLITTIKTTSNETITMYTNYGDIIPVRLETTGETVIKTDSGIIRWNEVAHVTQRSNPDYQPDKD